MPPKQLDAPFDGKTQWPRLDGYVRSLAPTRTMLSKVAWARIMLCSKSKWCDVLGFFTYASYGCPFRHVYAMEIPSSWCSTPSMSPKEERHLARRLRKQPVYPCVVCARPSSGKCEDCRSAHYCGRVCQQRDWPKHRLVCGQSASVQHNVVLEIPESTVAYAYQRWQIWTGVESIVPVCIASRVTWSQQRGINARFADAQLCKLGRPLVCDNWSRITSLPAEEVSQA